MTLPLTSFSAGTVHIDSVRTDAEHSVLAVEQLLSEATQSGDLLQQPILGGAALHTLCTSAATKL